MISGSMDWKGAGAEEGSRSGTFYATTGDTCTCGI